MLFNSQNSTCRLLGLKISNAVRKIFLSVGFRNLKIFIFNCYLLFSSFLLTPTQANIKNMSGSPYQRY